MNDNAVCNEIMKRRIHFNIVNLSLPDMFNTRYYVGEKYFKIFVGGHHFFYAFVVKFV